MNKIFIYNNLSEFNIESDDTHKVTYVQGNTISDIHNKVSSDVDVFCVITPVDFEDIIVSNVKDSDSVKYCLKNNKYKISIKPISIWYNSNFSFNIIISNTLDIKNEDLRQLLFKLSDLVNKEKSDKKEIYTQKEMYIVYHIRNNREIFRTPNYVKAKNMCDRNSGFAIKTRDGSIIYKSNYGKVTINIKGTPDISNKMKSSNIESNGVILKV